jgi:hypothetical protein
MRVLYRQRQQAAAQAVYGSIRGTLTESLRRARGRSKHSYRAEARVASRGDDGDLRYHHADQANQPEPPGRGEEQRDGRKPEGFGEAHHVDEGV